MPRPRKDMQGMELLLSQYLAKLIRTNARRSDPNITDRAIEIALSTDSDGTDNQVVSDIFNKWLNGAQAMSIDQRQYVAKQAQALGWYKEVIEAPDGNGGFFEIDNIEPLYRNLLFGDPTSNEPLAKTLRGMEKERKKFKNAKTRLIKAIDAFQVSIESLKYGTLGRIVDEPGRDTNMSRDTLIEDDFDFDFTRLRIDVVNSQVGYPRGGPLNGLDLLISK